MWSRWTASLMGVHTGGGSIRGLDRGDLQQHNTPLSYQRSVATIHCKANRGRDTEKTSFPTPSAHLSGGSGLKPQDRQKLFGHKIQLLARMDDAEADFPISLPSNTTCSKLPRVFLPALPPSSWIYKQVADTHLLTFLSFCSIPYSQARSGLFPCLSMLCGNQ